MRKTMLLILTLTAGVGSLVPTPVAAQECTRGYVTCLNDTHDLPKVFQVLADIECFSDYLKCVAN